MSENLSILNPPTQEVPPQEPTATWFSKLVKYVQEEPALVMTSVGVLLEAIVLIVPDLPPSKILAINMIIGVLIGLAIRRSVTPLSKLTGGSK